MAVDADMGCPLSAAAGWVWNQRSVVAEGWKADATHTRSSVAPPLL
jgi:hypothetical protein